MLNLAEIPSQYRSSLKLGTCSWKFDSWKGIVYQEDKKYGLGSYLQDYAKYFNTVEIDQWFWSLFPQGTKLPDSETVKIYSQSVPDDFVFTVKVPNSITLTHFYGKQPVKTQDFANKPNTHFLDIDLFHRFLELLEPMQTRLGPLMFQFEYLNKQKMPSCKAFLEQLEAFFAEAPSGFDYGVETRNTNYLRPDFFECLKRCKLGFVVLDGYYLPSVCEVAGRFDICTSDFSVIRLHGPNRQDIEGRTKGIWDRIVEEKNERLKATASIIKDNANKQTTTYVNVNNHYEGCAPLTIDRLLQLL